MPYAIYAEEKPTMNRAGNVINIARGFSSEQAAYAEIKKEKLNQATGNVARVRYYNDDSELDQYAAGYAQSNPALGYDPDSEQRRIRTQNLAEQAAEKVSKGEEISTAEADAFRRVSNEPINKAYERASGGVPFYQNLNAPPTEMEGSIEQNMARARAMSEARAADVANRASFETTGGGLLQRFRELPPEYQTNENLQFLSRSSEARQYLNTAAATSGKTTLTVDDIEAERAKIESRGSVTAQALSYTDLPKGLNSESLFESNNKNLITGGLILESNEKKDNYLDYSAPNPFINSLSSSLLTQPQFPSNRESHGNGDSLLYSINSLQSKQNLPQNLVYNNNEEKGQSNHISSFGVGVDNLYTQDESKTRPSGNSNRMGNVGNNPLLNNEFSLLDIPKNIQKRFDQRSEELQQNFESVGQELGDSDRLNRALFLPSYAIFRGTKFLGSTVVHPVESVKGFLEPLRVNSNLEPVGAQNVISALKKSGKEDPFGTTVDLATGAAVGGAIGKLASSAISRVNLKSKPSIIEADIVGAQDTVILDIRKGSTPKGQPITGKVVYTDVEQGLGSARLKVGDYDVFQTMTGEGTKTIVKQNDVVLKRSFSQDKPQFVDLQKLSEMRANEIKALRQLPEEPASLALSEQSLKTQFKGTGQATETNLFTKTKKTTELDLNTQQFSSDLTLSSDKVFKSTTGKPVFDFDSGMAGFEIKAAEIERIKPEFTFDDVLPDADTRFLLQNEFTGESTVGGTIEPRSATASSQFRNLRGKARFTTKKEFNFDLPDQPVPLFSTGVFEDITPIEQFKKAPKVKIKETQFRDFNQFPIPDFDIRLPRQRTPISRVPFARVPNSRVKQRPSFETGSTNDQEKFNKQLQKQMQNFQFKSSLGLNRVSDIRKNKSIPKLDVTPKSKINTIQSTKPDFDVRMQTAQLPKSDVAFDFMQDIKTDVIPELDLRTDLKIRPPNPRAPNFDLNIKLPPPKPPFLPDFDGGFNDFDYKPPKRQKQRKLYTPSIYSLEYGVRSNRSFKDLNKTGLSGLEIRPIPRDFAGGYSRKKTRRKRK